MCAAVCQTLWDSSWLFCGYVLKFGPVHLAPQALEVVREQLFRRLYAELPYSVQLRITSCLPADDGSRAWGWGGRRGSQSGWRTAIAGRPWLSSQANFAAHASSSSRQSQCTPSRPSQCG